MAREGRKKAGAVPPRNAWETMLEKATGPDPTQAGEVEPEMEEDSRGGGDKGRDTETGFGGYGGDAVEAGYEEAAIQPERPLDAEIHGDPRTHAGEEYPGGVSAGEAIEDAGDGRSPGDVGGMNVDEIPGDADATASANARPPKSNTRAGGARRGGAESAESGERSRDTARERGYTGDEATDEPPLVNPGDSPDPHTAQPRRRGRRSPGEPVEGTGVTTRTRPGRGMGARRGGTRNESTSKRPPGAGTRDSRTTGRRSTGTRRTP